MDHDIATMVLTECALIREQLKAANNSVDYRMPTHRLVSSWVAVSTIEDLMYLEQCTPEVIERAKALLPVK